MGLFWDEPVRKSKAPVIVPPEKVWLLPTYLPHLDEAEVLDGVQQMPLSDLWKKKTPLLIDLEIMPNYFEVGFMDDETGMVHWEETKHDTDASNMEGFNWDLVEWVLKNRLTVGFNSKTFDMIVLAVGLETRSFEAMRKATYMLIDQDMHHNEVLEHFGIMSGAMDAYDHIDLIEVAPLKGSLKIYAGRIMIENMMDLPFSPYMTLTPDHKTIIRFYNLARDLPSTRALFGTLKPQIELRLQMSNEYGLDLRSKSDAQIAEHVIKHELRKVLGKVPRQPKVEPGTRFNYTPPDFLNFTYGPFVNALNTARAANFYIEPSGGFAMPKEIADLVLELNGLGLTMGLGGLHSTESRAAHWDDDEYELWDYDVTSYYPFIILNLKLFPPHLTEAFLYVFRQIVNRRVDAKKNMMEVIADSLKIVINGSFGKLGSMWSNLYAPLLMITVTITGQLALMMLMDMANQFDIRAVSANTDGVVFKVKKKDVPMLRRVVAEWERVTGFTMEGTRYMALLSRDVNNYYAIKCKYDKDKKDFIPVADGVKTKGVYYDPTKSKNKADMLKKNPTNLIVTMAVEAKLLHGTDVAETVRGCTDITKFVTVRSVKDGACYITNYDPPKHKSKLELVLLAGFKEDMETFCYYHPDILDNKNSGSSGFPIQYTLNQAYDMAFKSLSSHDTEYLGKSIRWYQATGTLGNMVNAKSGHTVSDSAGSKPLMRLPKHIPSDLDYDWYIQRAERALTEIGYYD
ncbi:DNA polymerase [Stenotrophomonas phage vB_SmaS_Bhz55]